MGEVDTTDITPAEGQASAAAAVQPSFLSRAAHLAGSGGQAVMRGGRRATEGVARGAWAYKALTSVAPPAAPVAEPWVLSVGALLGRHPRTPQLVHKVLGMLDGFGAVRLSPATVGFDGEQIPWEKIVEVRTRNAFEVMTTSALEREVDRIRQFLPPVPGRKWLVTRAAEALATVVLAALEHGSVERPLDQIEVPVEIVHKGLLGRQHVLVGGLFATAGLVVAGQAAQSLTATARERGIPVVPGRPLAEVRPDQADRVALLRDRTDATAEFLTRLQHDADATDTAGPSEATGSTGSTGTKETTGPVDPRTNWAG